MSDWERTHAPASRRLRFGAVASVLAVLLVYVGMVLAGGDTRPRPDEDISVEESADLLPPTGPDQRPREVETVPDPPTPEPAPVGTWRPLADSPLPPGRVAASAWTGEELLVWHGDRQWAHPAEPDAAAAYHPGRDEWRTIAEPPVRAGEQTGAVWTGSAWVVLGAIEVTDQPARPDPAVAYLPATDTWRRLAPAPAGSWLWDAAVWNGQEVVLLGSTRTAAGQEQPAAVGYDPEDDAWTALPPPPVWSQGGRLQTAALDGHVVVVGEVPARRWDETERALTAYDPETGVWSDPEPVPYQGLWSVGVVAVPDAGHVALVGAVQEGIWRDLTGTWTAGDGVEWHALPEWRAWGQRHPALLATDHGLLAWAQGAETGWLLDDDEGDWRRLAASPLGSRRNAAIVWTGSDLLVWGGTRGQSLREDGAAWRPQH